MLFFLLKKAPRSSLASTLSTQILDSNINTWLSLDEAKAQKVVAEIKASGGDAIAVGGDVGADDFPEKILRATVEYVLTFLSHFRRFIFYRYICQKIREAESYR